MPLLTGFHARAGAPSTTSLDSYHMLFKVERAGLESFSSVGAPCPREGLMPVAVGMAIGVVISLAMGRVLNSLLLEVRAGDPSIPLGAVLVMIAVAIAACYLARRASRVDPLVALRYE